MKRAAALIAALLVAPPAIGAQTLIREAELSVGHSTDEVQAAGMQGRVFGALTEAWKVYLEASWAGVTKTGSDAFGAAFPYDNRIRPMEVYAERLGSAGGMLVGLRAGRYRVPFGIYGRSEHGYSGFTRAPLIRYGADWALSNIALDTGVAVLVGTPALQVEASLGVPTDDIDRPRPRTANGVIRVQAFRGPFIVGASYLNGRAYAEGPWVTGRSSFGGVDARWMHAGVQLRGEWIFGRPFDDVATYGGYVDMTLHRESMGPVTLVLRAERLDYPADEFSEYLRRYTAGVRVRTPINLSLQLNLHRQPGGFVDGRAVALDVGLTQTIRF
jgi:hypothetical protein